MIVYPREPTLISTQNAASIPASLPNVIAVLFDLDDTLIDTSAAKEKKQEACIAVLEENGAAATDGDALRYYQLFYGIMNSRSDQPLQTLGLPEKQLDALLMAYNSIWPELLPGAKETLDALGERGYVRGCVTNGPSKLQREKIQRLGLGSFKEGSSLLVEGSSLDFAVISGDVSCEKPGEAIYVAALNLARQRLGDAIHPEKVVFAGDRPSDWIGANKVGMISVQLLRDGADPAAGREQSSQQTADKPHYVIASLSDLLRMLPGSGAHVQESYAAAH